MTMAQSRTSRAFTVVMSRTCGHPFCEVIESDLDSDMPPRSNRRAEVTIDTDFDDSAGGSVLNFRKTMPNPLLVILATGCGSGNNDPEHVPEPSAPTAIQIVLPEGWCRSSSTAIVAGTLTVTRRYGACNLRRVGYSFVGGTSSRPRTATVH